jgi:hypothetical protein
MSLINTSEKNSNSGRAYTFLQNHPQADKVHCWLTSRGHSINAKGKGARARARERERDREREFIRNDKARYSSIISHESAGRVRQAQLKRGYTYATTSSAPADQGSLRVSSATLTTLITSSRAPLRTRYATIVTHMRSIVRWSFYRRACGSGFLLRMSSLQNLRCKDGVYTPHS